MVTPQLEKALAGSHHRVVRQMAGMAPKHQQDVIWVYLPIRTVLTMVGLD